jgi:hypothetical protein
LDQHFRDGLLLLGIDPERRVDPRDAVRAVEEDAGLPLPASVVELLSFPGVMAALAKASDGHAVVELADETYMADVPGPVLALLYENQGVVVWGVPLDQGDDPRVLVGHQEADDEPTVQYTASVAEFVYGMAWDGRLLDQEPLLEAHLDKLDPHALAALRSSYREVIQTHGWPGNSCYRFEAEGGLKVRITDADSICDWYVSAADADALLREAEWLMTLRMTPYDLKASFWSHHDKGEQLLTRLRASPNLG